ncbi:MAG: M28 family peptidase [bacterium]|nr:M28 family peptidase [bacterium]
MRLLLLSIFLLLLHAPSRAAGVEISPSLMAALALVSPDSIRVHADYLGSDALAGRSVGTAGAQAAAEYISRVLGRAELIPAGPDGSWLQPVPMHGGTPLPESLLEVVGPDGTKRLQLGQDYLLYKTGAKTLLPRPVPLVFVGYGIVAPEYDYNDYQSVDVAGKGVVFLAGEPLTADRSYFSGDLPTLHSLPESKQRQAIARGAVGSIMILPPRSQVDRTWEQWQNEFAFEYVTSLYEVAANLSVLLSPEQSAQLFEGAPKSVQDVYGMDLANTMQSFALACSTRFIGQFHEREFVDHNVIGRLPGSDPTSKESVILCAHYDHLGVGPRIDGDDIYNGVVDNALGVAVVLEIARVLQLQHVALTRPVLFLLLTGEENGLLGAKHYCAHPVVPLHRTIAAVNVDGPGFIDTFDDVTGVGAELSTLEPILVRVAAELGLDVSPIPPILRAFDAFARSDQLAFAQAGVPSLLIMEGLRYRHLSADEGFRRFVSWGVRYHSPFDDLQQPLNYAATAQHARVVLALVGALANTSNPPRWHEGSPYHSIRLRSMAEGR